MYRLPAARRAAAFLHWILGGQRGISTVDTLSR